MVEQQVDKKLVAAHVQQHLAANKGKACAQLQQEFGDVFDQGGFDFALLRFIVPERELALAMLANAAVDWTPPLRSFEVALDRF